MSEFDDFLDDLDQLILNANNRNRDLSGELTFIRDQNVDVDLHFARNLEAQAHQVYGELLAYEKVQKLCMKLIEEEDEEDDENNLSY